MPKRAKKTLNPCQQHLFILKPKHNFCRFGQTVTVSFCDPGQDKSKGRNKKCRNCQSLDCPTFNNDRNFATPTFILSSQKQFYDQRGVKMRQQHQRKMFEYTDQKDSLNIPKPRTRNNFCSVCRQVYEDYLQVNKFVNIVQHIESQKHKKKINASLFNKYILDAAQKYNPIPKNIFAYSYPTLSTRDEEELEVLEMVGRRGVKRVKGECEGEYQQNYQQQQENVIMPPPHLNLSNSAYFPGLMGQTLTGGNQQNGVMPQNAMGYYASNPYQYHPQQQYVPSQQQQQMTYNYNMNFFWPAYFNPQLQHSYGMMNSNPWFNNGNNLDFLPQNTAMNTYNQQQQANCSMNMLMMNNNNTNTNKYINLINNQQQKRQTINNNMNNINNIININKDQIIIIDDQQHHQFNNNNNNIEYNDVVV